MAHKKGAGSTKNGRDSNANRLGVKRFGGEKRQKIDPPIFYHFLELTPK